MPTLTQKLSSYRLCKRMGQAVVSLNGIDHYLGLFGTVESKQLYARLIKEWIVKGDTMRRNAKINPLPSR